MSVYLSMPIVHFPEFPAFTIADANASAKSQLALVDLDRLRGLLSAGQARNLCAEWLWTKGDFSRNRPGEDACGRSGDEQGRFYGLLQDKRRCEWLGGRIAAKTAVLNYLRRQRNQRDNDGPLGSPASFPIRSLPSGRPFLAPDSRTNGEDTPHISISHSQKYAMAIAATTPCGVDIQVSRATLMRVRDRFCSPQEEIVLAAKMPLLNDLERLTLLWAAKEAVKKQAGGEIMPGFLDMEVSHIESCQPGPYRNGDATGLPVSFSLLVRPVPRGQGGVASPGVAAVAVALHQDYGLALCLPDARNTTGGNDA